MPENPKYKLIGQNYELPDLVAKVTGRAKYAEDFRADGMLFAKLLLSPVPHARIRRVDASAALAMPGVVAVITGEDIPKPQQPMQLGEAAAAASQHASGGRARKRAALPGRADCGRGGDRRADRADAIEKIKVEYEPLPFVVDPMVTLRPGGPNPRAEGNIWRPPQVQEMKISEAEVAELDAGRIPLLENTPDQVGRRRRRRRLQERGLHPRRDARAPVHRPPADGAAHGDGVLAERQAVPARLDAVGRAHGRERRAVGRHPAGSGRRHQRVHRRRVRRQDSGRADDGDSGDPVEEDRPSRDDAHQRAKKRTTSAARVRAFICARRSASARMAASLRWTCARSETAGRTPIRAMSARWAATATALYNPETMRFRGVAVLTNTPPRVSQRAPGGEQAAAMLEPMISKAARHLGVDQVEIRKINAPVTGSEFGPPPPPAAAGAAAAARRRVRRSRWCAGRSSGGRAAAAGGAGTRHGKRSGGGGQVPGQQPVAAAAPPAAPQRSFFTSCHLREALDHGASSSTGTSASCATASATAPKSRASASASAPTRPVRLRWTDCLLVRHDGKLYVHSGIGNLGTGSVMDCSRMVAEVLEHAVGTDARSSGATRASTWHGARRRRAARRFMRTRARTTRRRMDAKQKLQEIAAQELGGSPDELRPSRNERVVPKGPARDDVRAGGDAAIKLGGKYDGHEMPNDINDDDEDVGRQRLAGQGLMGVARDNFGRKGNTQSWVAGFAEVEVDVETGEYQLVDYLAVADCRHRASTRAAWRAQLHGGGDAGLRADSQSEVGLRPALRRLAGATGSTTTNHRRFSTFRSTKWSGGRSRFRIRRRRSAPRASASPRCARERRRRSVR